MEIDGKAAIHKKQPVYDVVAQFQGRFGREPEWVIVAPGRVNLIGDHTDYNDGFVFPMAIERETVIAAARRDESPQPVFRAYSLSLDEDDEFEVSRGRLDSTGKWTDYIKGVLAEFLGRGLAAESLDILVESNVPMGCGLSSSAALQVATAKLLQQLGTAAVSDEAIPGLCQAAEHEFAGVPVGIMDPFCIANARKGHGVYLDCRTFEAEHIPFDDTDTAVLIVDSKVTRELRSGAYAERRAQCDQACRIMGIDKLRDASDETVEAARQALGDVCYRRARHVTTEDARTISAVSAMRASDWARFGELMYESHNSLKDDFETSCREIDVLIGLASEIGIRGGVYGARMTGGGFGCCVVALIDRNKADDIIDALAAGYQRATDKTLSAYVSSPAPGARAVARQEWGTQ